MSEPKKESKNKPVKSSKAKLKKILELDLKHGSHKSFKEGGCVMEMVSYIANEPWSDHPKCACPILTSYAIRINDAFNGEHRQKLKPLIPLLVNTKESDETQIARKRLIRWRNVTATCPLILDLLKLTEIATELRAFKNTLEDMAKAAKYLESKKEEIKKTYYAYANAYANANANANAYADAYAYAYADAYAYAYADAYAFREKISDVAVETLRLAIEVKE